MFCTTSCIKIAVGGALTVGCMYYTAKVVAVGCMYPVARALLPKTTASDPPLMVSTEADRKRIEELEQQVQSLKQQVQSLTKVAEDQRSLADAARYFRSGLQSQVDRYSRFCFRLPHMAASIVRQSSWGRDTSKEDVTDTFMELTDEFDIAVVSDDSMEQFLAKYPRK